MLTSLSTEDLIPKGHPIRRIRKVVDDVLAEMDGEFDAMYSRIGRPSVPPEQLLKATILMARGCQEFRVRQSVEGVGNPAGVGDSEGVEGVLPALGVGAEFAASVVADVVDR